MAHQRGLLDFWSDHNAGRIAQEQNGQIESVAQLHETRRLIRAVRINRAAKVHRIVRNHAHRFALDARQCRHHPHAKRRAQLQDTTRIGERLDD